MAPCVRFSLLGKAVARLIGFCPVCVSWQKRSVTAPFRHKVDDFDIALDGTTVLIQNATELPFMVRHAEEVQMAVKEFGKGRGVYISGLPYSFKNSRVLHRAILWSASAEDELYRWYSTNYNVEVHAYVKNGKYCVVNNTYEPQDTTVYLGDGTSFDLHLEANEIKWYQI